MNIITIKKTTFFIIALSFLAAFSIALNIFLVCTIAKNNQAYSQHQVNQKVVDFRNMFEQNVLLSGKEVDFETRLSLETAVRALNDKEIFKCWEGFTTAQTKDDATAQTKNLLEVLIKKTAK